ncbi:uncharacterized protein LOC126252669 [Schistocerca nitens]|uniref:uncharacterized protein LOC126252669 n=1 Tax=Schistocerca nitens TaxID=7011 RepID=UPI0021188DEB|nr:uncharacterized protein LOC126252669 [Schistocerca nitens]
MTYEEFMALECLSGSEDELDFDDSDEDPTINVNDLESADSDSEPEATVVNTHNSNNYCLKDDENEAVADAQVSKASEKHQKVQKNRIIWKKQSASSGNDKFKFGGKSSLPQSLAPPTAVRDLWNDVIGVEVAKQTMSQRYFESLMATLHFNDNTKRPNTESQDNDKLYKIRPIIDHVNKKCLLVPMSERLSVDEQICATKARHHMKVYMKDKPHKWGYKLFVLCGVMRFAHNIEIYSGQENNPKFRLDNEADIGASGNVIRLISEVPRYQNYKISFD